MPAGSTALTSASWARDAGLLNIYSFPGLVFIIALYSFPYAVVFTSAALEMVSSEMEDAANILGASRVTLTRRVTLPLVLPAILAAGIVIFLEAISIISSTIMIALPARINLVPLQLWEFFGYPAAARGRGSLFHPAAAGDRDAVLAPEGDPRPAGLRHADRQGRRAPAHAARRLALGVPRL